MTKLSGEFAGKSKNLSEQRIARASSIWAGNLPGGADLRAAILMTQRSSVEQIHFSTIQLYLQPRIFQPKKSNQRAIKLG